MKSLLFVFSVLILSGFFLGCNKKESSQPEIDTKVERKNVVLGSITDSDRALAFLTGIQNNDKKLMYEVSNLTPEMVDESRIKLTNTVKYKQTKKERTETEHALRMSGSIDFFLKKLTNIFPKSAQLQVTKTTHETSTKDPVSVHHVKITYSKKGDALLDKKGQRIKEMVVRLQQVSHGINGLTLQEFVFGNNHFDKMADKEYEVLSYY